ncbi:ASCH domain-containing protein [Brevibacillus migulae]|uniref:ASCH domain-containing protein n=1 Tax=Brevibacillus migulae TaxID=1644114 RepID=UPI00106E986A|nr:ASCH domain-containing protein [Brevibacillus migulae]
MKRTTFWGRDEHDERLVEQIIAGIKTATCTPKHWYEQAPDEMTEVGEQIEVYSKLGEYMCTIEITQKYELPFGQIDEATVKGENCSSYEEFRQDHITSWAEDLKKEGLELNDEMIIVIEHFRLVKVKK